MREMEEQVEEEGGNYSAIGMTSLQTSNKA